MADSNRNWPRTFRPSVVNCVSHTTPNPAPYSAYKLTSPITRKQSLNLPDKFRCRAFEAFQDSLAMNLSNRPIIGSRMASLSYLSSVSLSPNLYEWEQSYWRYRIHLLFFSSPVVASSVLCFDPVIACRVPSGSRSPVRKLEGLRPVTMCRLR